MWNTSTNIKSYVIAEYLITLKSVHDVFLSKKSKLKIVLTVCFLLNWNIHMYIFAQIHTGKKRTESPRGGITSDFYFVYVFLNSPISLC